MAAAGCCWNLLPAEGVEGERTVGPALLILAEPVRAAQSQAVVPAPAVMCCSGCGWRWLGPSEGQKQGACCQPQTRGHRQAVRVQLGAGVTAGWPAEPARLLDWGLRVVLDLEGPEGWAGQELG